MASQFPAWLGWKADLTGAKGVTKVSSQDELIAAEFQATPGSWKLFPFTAAGEAAASAYAGVPNPGAGGTAGEGVAVVGAAESAATAVPDFLSRLTDATTWIRVAEVAAGLLLIAIGLAEITKAVPIATTIAKAVK
jgi:hypothetical protein